MKYIKLIVLSALLPAFATAQSLERTVIATAGDYSEAGSISLSYTIGEVVVETKSTPSLILTQGFQQSKLKIVGIEVPEMNLSLKAYPNPTHSEVILEVHSTDAIHLNLTILNLHGQLMEHRDIKAISPHKLHLDFSQWAAGSYFLHLAKPHGLSQTIKIEKIN